MISPAEQIRERAQKLLDDGGHAHGAEVRAVLRPLLDLLASQSRALEEAQRELTDALKSEGQKDEWIEMLAQSFRNVVLAALPDDEWEGSVAEGMDILQAKFAEVNAQLTAAQGEIAQAREALRLQAEALNAFVREREQAEAERARLREALKRAIDIACVQDWTGDEVLFAEMNTLSALLSTPSRPTEEP